MPKKIKEIGKFKVGDMAKSPTNEELVSILESGILPFETEKIDKGLIGAKVLLAFQQLGKVFFSGIPMIVKDVSTNQITLNIGRLSEDSKDKEQRQKLAQVITKSIRYNLEKQISDKVMEALKERPLFELKLLKKYIKFKGPEKEPELERTRGCLYLKLGDRSIKI